MRNDHAMLSTPHPRRVGLNEHLHRARIQRPPAPPSFAEVVTPAPTLTHPAPAHRAAGRTHPNDHAPLVVPGTALVDFNPFDNRLLDAQQGAPYADVAHAVLRSPFLTLDKPETYDGNGVLHTTRSSEHPRIRQ